jgi:hypothetical protein
MKMNSPEKILRLITAVFLLTGFILIGVGYILEQDLLDSVGRWCLVIAIVLAFLPLVLFLGGLVFEYTRKRM